MDRNVGGIERAFRLIAGSLMIGLALMAAFLGYDTGLQEFSMISGMLIMGAVLLVTGILQRCPINKALGRNSCEENRSSTMP